MDTFIHAGPALQATIVILIGWCVIVMMGWTITFLRGLFGWLIDTVHPKATVVDLADYRRRQLNAVVRAGDRRRVS
jgi:hypothetical protein